MIVKLEIRLVGDVMCTIEGGAKGMCYVSLVIFTLMSPTHVVL